MILDLNVNNIFGLTDAERADLQALIAVFNLHQGKNAQKERYYEGHIRLSEANLGIALPKSFSNLEIGCSWGAKTVDVLAGLSMFDGFVGTRGEAVAELEKISAGNRLISEYSKACVEQLKFGCVFATLSKSSELGCKIRFHSPLSASALWDGEKGRIKCGMAIVEMAAADKLNPVEKPKQINFYTDKKIIVLRFERGAWLAEGFSHKMGRPLMEPLIWNATAKKPFGRSRIKGPVRNLIKGYVRTVANATIGLEFSTSPQKFLIGVSEQMFDEIVTQKFQQYTGSILTATNNPETGDNPVFGQLPQGSISPHVDMMRILSTQFSAATGLPVTDTGVVNDANPTSSEAIIAQSRTLIRLAEDLNAGNGESLKCIAQMALAISKDLPISSLSEDEKDIVAHFKNPAMPSVSVTADAAVKIAGVRPEFAKTDTFLEMLGFSQAEIRRITAQEQRARGLALFEELGA